MKVSKGLLFLSALASIEASGLDAMQKLTGIFAKLAIEECKPSIYDSSAMVDFGALDRGDELWQEAQRPGTMPKDIVDTLDNEMGEIFRSKADIETKIAWITQVLACFDNPKSFYTYEELYEIAQEENKINFLSAAMAFNHCETFEEFLPVLIFGYGKDWCRKEFWAMHKKDWEMVKLDTKLDVILEANNPRFLEDFLNNKLPYVVTLCSLSGDQILDLVVEHDFLDIFNHYKNSGTVTFEQLHKRIGKLVQFGSVKLLRALHGITGENLNLQDFSAYLEKLPEHPGDWEFLKEQGCQYMPVGMILEAACKGGHTYILKEFYEINEILVSAIYDLEDATRGGHWDTIKWAIDNGISNEKGRLLFLAILDGHFEFVHLFESEYNFQIDIDSNITADLYGYNFTEGASVVQALADKAAELGRSRVVEWISDRFNVLPKKSELNGATIKILKLLKLKKPEIFDTDLLISEIQMSSMKWMWSNYGHLFTDEIKKYWTNGYNNGKELRWIHKNWRMLPEYIDSNISVKDLEFFMEVTKGKVDISGVAWCAIREGDFEKVKFFISKYPSCLKMEFIDNALEYGNIEIANMLDKHFGYQFVSLWRACTCSHLGILKRSIKSHEYSLGQIKNGVFDAIRADQLEIVDYMMYKGYVNANRGDRYMNFAIRHDSIRVFKFLIKRFGESKLPEGYLMYCWKNTSFKILKFILPRLSKSEIEMLLEQDFDIYNYHLRIIAKEGYEKRI